MAAYASATEMRARYPERDLAQATDPAGKVVDDVRLTEVLEDASAEVDSYLRGRYSLPLASPPAELTGPTCAIAMYRLVPNRRAEDVEEIRNRYKDAVAFLSRVAEGKVVLDTNGAADGTGALGHGRTTVLSSAATPITFTY